MNRHSLRTRILLFSVLPILIIGIGMTAFFSLNRYSQLNNNLVNQARSIIYPLSTSASFALTEKSVPLLQGLVNEAARNDARNIVAIAVFDRNNKMLVTSSIAPETNSFKLSPENREYIYTKESTEFTNDGLIMRMPIYGYNPEVMLTLYGEYNPQVTDSENNNKTTELPEFADPKLNYPRKIAGYICIYFLRDQTVMDVYQDITIAITILLFSILISVLLAISLNRRIVDPINSLCSAVYEIREGNVTARVNGAMTGELERLRTYVNSMANAMSELHSEMQYNVDTTTNDLRHTLEKLEQQNNELNEANFRADNAAKIKSEFLANMSHELRTPLNGILGFAKQMYKSQLSTEQTDYLNTIERSANNLLRIVSNILDFSKLEAGKLTFESIPFSLRNACQDTVHLLSPIALEKGLELTFSRAPDVPDSVLGDPIRFQQILTNLLGNAIKFTSKGNVALDIAIKEKNTKYTDLVFTVKDTGIGINEEQQQELFTAFTQADSSINRRYGGTGLGLVITKHLIEQYHGKITLESKVGIGTTFTFNIQLENGVEENPDNTSSELYGQKAVVSEVNTWVRDSIVLTLKSMGITTFPMSNLLPINTLPEQNELDYIIIGLSANFDYSRLLYYYSSIKPEILSRIKRIIFAVNTIDSEVHAKLRSLSPKASIMIKPILYDRLYDTLRAPQQESENSIEHVETVEEQTNVQPTSSIAIPHSEKNLIKATVLAVDDNSANLKLIGTLLREIVTDVYTAENGQEAVELCSHTEFDLIFMDIQMPIMDGLDAMHEIRKNSVNKDTPIIAVSALAIKEEQERFIREGMNDYMSKPLEEHQLQELVRRYCGNNAPVSIQPQASDVSTNNNASVDDNPQAIWSITRALKQTAGHRDLAHEMLKMLTESIPNFKKTLAEPDAIPALDLAKAVHKFAGGAAYCGMPEIKKLCNIIESALKAGQTADDVEPELFELADAVDNIEKNATQWLQQLEN